MLLVAVITDLTVNNPNFRQFVCDITYKRSSTFWNDLLRAKQTKTPKTKTDYFDFC